VAYSESYILRLREVGKYPLLTRQEEIELAVRIQAGDAEALEWMILSNLRFAVCVANQFAGLGLSLEDLVQESTRGLMIAAQRYRPGYGAKFSSYAGWWCRQSVRSAITKQARGIRLPQFVVDRLSKLRRAEQDGELSAEELAESTGLSRLRRCGRWPCQSPRWMPRPLTARLRRPWEKSSRTREQSTRYIG
jgi:RNA polymerase primary sigma factor